MRFGTPAHVSSRSDRVLHPEACQIHFRSRPLTSSLSGRAGFLCREFPLNPCRYGVERFTCGVKRASALGEFFSRRLDTRDLWSPRLIDRNWLEGRLACCIRRNVVSVSSSRVYSSRQLGGDLWRSGIRFSFSIGECRGARIPAGSLDHDYYGRQRRV